MGVATLPDMGDFDALYATLSRDPRIKGRQFELLCRFLLERDPTYASRVRRVWLWREWPGRWREDGSGIDLLAEDADGKLWAIQAKAYREDKPIRKSELDKFLSDSSRKEFSYRLLISTASGLHPTARETVAAQEKPVFVVDRHALRAAPVDWPASFEDLPASGEKDVGEPRLPENLDLLLASTEELVAALRVREAVDPRWERSFCLLERFVDEVGHARPAGDCRYEGHSLGRWVIHQRQRWARGKLSPEKVERLQQLPGWVFSCYEAAWVDNHHQLAQFVSVHGSPSVPLDFRAANGKSLGAWIVNQRTRYSQGKLPEHRVRLLEALPGWAWTGDGDSRSAQ